MKVGVIGAGTMGSGIAQAFAASGKYEVVLCDVDIKTAELGKAKIEKNINRMVEKGKLASSAADTLLESISAGKIEDTAGCGLIIEAAVENMAAKRGLFQRLQNICRKDAIFATNTSSLSITEIGIGIEQQVVGMHFFNPAPIMELVEVIAGLHTPRETVESVSAIAADIGKKPVEVKEEAGFVVNRILIPMINEAVGVLAEGVASAQDIDTAMKLGANHPIGPLALGDLIGLDVCLAIMEVLHAESGDGKYRPHPLLRKMVRGEMLGRKTGRGFFEYKN